MTFFPEYSAIIEAKSFSLISDALSATLYASPQEPLSRTVSNPETVSTIYKYE